MKDINLRIPFIFFSFMLLIILLAITFLFLSIKKPANYKHTTIKIIKSAVRGNIYTNEFSLAKSKKIFNVYINTSIIKKEKLNLFIDLFSIYTNVNKQTLIKKFNSNKKIVFLTKVDEITKNSLIYLNRILALKYRVFIPNKKSGYIIGIRIEKSNPPFKRIYPYDDTFEPFLGRYRTIEQNGKIIGKGDNGIERYYDKYLKEKKDGFIQGKRDVLGRVIYDKSAIIKYPINGYNIKLNIDLVLQKRVENILDEAKKEANASEVIAAVIESKTGKVLTFASSNRYNPNHIKKEDIKNMKISAIRTLYEPGSVLKPITLAILLENKKVNLLEVIKGYNGRWKPKWRKTPIKDDEPFEWLTPRKIIIYSSNIGISQLALRLTEDEFYKGLSNFGLNKKTNIDLPYEIKGRIRPKYLLRYPIYKSTTAYGYGILTTFTELLKAYNSFNNNGESVDLSIAANKIASSKQIISPSTAQQIKDILRDVVLKGTAKKAYIKGIFTAGKTGTAHINTKGKYENIYNSSFFGFANDKTHKYTIGVVFFNIKSPRYFASETAVPVFKKIVNSMIEKKLLKKGLNE